MGLGSVVKKVAGAVGIGGGGGSGSSSTPPPPDLSELEALRTRQSRAASDFRTNQAGMQEEQDRSSRMDARSELARDLAQNRKGASSRGLLYSGLKQAADVGAESGMAASVAQNRAATAAQLENQARGLEDQAANTGISLQMNKQGIADNSYAMALQNRQAQLQAQGALGGAVGTVAGSALANRKRAGNSGNSLAEYEELDRGRGLA